MKRRATPLLMAPHRGFFLLGMTVFVTAMAWWLAAMAVPPATIMPMSWLHGWLSMFGMLAPFISGFLFTAYPRWLGADPPGPACWLTSLALQGCGTLLFAVGAYVHPVWCLAGAACWLTAWLLVAGHLVRALRQGDGAALHATTMAVSVALGLVSLVLLIVWLGFDQVRYGVLGLQLAFWGFLLGAYLVVTHRMIPFFAGCVLKPYQPFRPAWALLLSLGLGWGHLLLLSLGLYSYLWLPDGALAALATWLAIRWQWWRSGAQRLLAALFIGWFGLVAGFAVGAAQSLYLFLAGDWVGGRIPEHIVGMAFFGAMVIAMGTRVTLGHSGRPLRMGAAAWWSLLGITLAAAVRALAEVTPLRQELMLASAVIWIVSGLTWLLHHGPMLVRPRVDGKPG